MRQFARALAVGAMSLMPLGAAFAADKVQVISSPSMENVVAIEILDVDGSVIKGRLTNKSAHRIDAPQLMAKYNWLWRDDHHPGPDDPGWVTFVDLPKDLDANESADFTIDPGRPLPKRDDGEFVTSVAVTRLTQYHWADAE